MLRKLIILALLLNTGYLQAQEYTFNPRNRDLKLLKRNNFDPFYEGQNLQVNEHLELAFRKNRNANGWLITSAVISSVPLLAYAGLPGMGIGYAIKVQSRKQMRIATALHLSTLTDQTFSGTEDFRRPERIGWYHKKNFYVQYYNGQNEATNQALNLAWDLKRKANSEMFYGTLSGTVGSTLLLVSFINFIVNNFSGGNGSVLLPFVAGTALTATGTILIITADKKKNQVELNLWNATEQWYTDLHKIAPKDQ